MYLDPRSKSVLFMVSLILDYISNDSGLYAKKVSEEFIEKSEEFSEMGRVPVLLSKDNEV